MYGRQEEKYYFGIQTENEIESDEDDNLPLSILKQNIKRASSVYRKLPENSRSAKEITDNDNRKKEVYKSAFSVAEPVTTVLKSISEPGSKCLQNVPLSVNTDQARDLTSLKLKYDNIKRNLKKKIQNNKKQLTKTGGGPPQEEPLLWYEEALYQVLQVSIDGLPSEGDSDALTTPLKKNDPKPSTSYSFRALLEDNPDGEALRTVEIVEIDVVSDIGESSTRAKSGWNLKRKRTISAVDKETSLHAFEALSEKKTDLASEQKKCFEVELRMKLVEEKKPKRGMGH
ncbi:unnamed protein product [Ceutorhynchus assimilis]|uniref:Uncharacterized protein n=1 Tax=Ceutorhynchus assimilis TaxID=467358 RepID=A0A9N9MTD9_9CUCU|nr:unnamed protein product [Ceutorhynchus assimilis]